MCYDVISTVTYYLITESWTVKFNGCKLFESMSLETFWVSLNSEFDLGNDYHCIDVAKIKIFDCHFYLIFFEKTIKYPTLWIMYVFNIQYSLMLKRKLTLHSLLPKLLRNNVGSFGNSELQKCFADKNLTLPF